MTHVPCHITWDGFGRLPWLPFPVWCSVPRRSVAWPRNVLYKSLVSLYEQNVFFIQKILILTTWIHLQSSLTNSINNGNDKWSSEWGNGWSLHDQRAPEVEGRPRPIQIVRCDTGYWTRIWECQSQELVESPQLWRFDTRLGHYEFVHLPKQRLADFKPKLTVNAHSISAWGRLLQSSEWYGRQTSNGAGWPTRKAHRKA